VSARLERALAALDVGTQEPTGPHYGFDTDTSDRVCWRCQRHPSRVLGKDYLCEACFAWVSMETDDDPLNTWYPGLEW
jgi:hypothetical protein